MSWDAKDADEKFKDLSARGIAWKQVYSSEKAIAMFDCEPLQGQPLQANYYLNLGKFFG